MLTIYSYPPCGTCKKAKKWLTEKGIEFNEVHIVEQTPTKEEIKKLYQDSGLPLKKFFNTSGQKYRELGLKEVVNDASEDELLNILASDGMLLKRPIATDGKQVTVGFKEADFEAAWVHK